MDEKKIILFSNIIKKRINGRKKNREMWDECLSKHRNLFRKQQRCLVEKYKHVFLQTCLEYIKSISILNISSRSVNLFLKSDILWRNFFDNNNENVWKESFRISKCSFMQLCSRLKPYLQPKYNPISNNERDLPVEKQVAITIFKLASCSEYRVVGNIFGVHKSTVQRTFYKVISTINEYLLKEFVILPTVDEAQAICAQFEKVCGIPRIICCIDGTHIPVLPPSEGYRDFVNRKGWPSLLLQIVVDNSLIIRDFSCKLPGSAHDANAFKNSGFFESFPQQFAEHTLPIEGKEIPFIVIGDPAYPLLKWLIKDYPGSNLSRDKEFFNKRLNKARVKVEIAIGRLKSRWRILMKRSDIDHKFMPKVVAAACALHNIIEKSGNTSDLTTSEPSTCYPQPQNIIITNTSVEGGEIRDVLCTYLNKNSINV